MLYRSVTNGSCELAAEATFSCQLGKCLIESDASAGNFTGFEECSYLCEGCSPNPLLSEVILFFFSLSIDSKLYL